MRITIVTETYFPQVNGVSRTLGQLVRVLRAAGDEVQLVQPDYGRPAESPGDVLVRSEALPFYRELVLPVPPFGRVHERIARFQPDLIQIATEATLGLSVLRFARKRGIPVVSSFHTNFDQYTAHYQVGWLNGLVWRYLRWFHNATRETYVPSRVTMARLRARGFERLVLWPRGVDSRHFSPWRAGREAVRGALGIRPEHVVVGYISRLAAEKNVGYLSSALAGLARKAGDRARLLIVGDGPARGEMERVLGPAAHFAGYKTGEELADHYAACDIFAFSSLTETFGNVILEAMASGLPVVAMRAGGPGETVRDGETGFLVDPAEPPEAMTACLARLVDDEALRRTMSARARAYAESQSWDKIMCELRERYERIVEPPGTCLHAGLA